MTIRIVAFLLTIFICPSIYAQTDTLRVTAVIPPTDTNKQLPEVVVHAYEQYGSILLLPAAVIIVNAADLSQYKSLLQWHSLHRP